MKKDVDQKRDQIYHLGMSIAHWTETVTDSLSLAQAFLFDWNSMKGDIVTRERLIRFETRCAGGPDMFWAALTEYTGREEAARLRSIRSAS